LQAVQEAAREAGFLYPLDLGGRGTCRIGGNVGTNAGGNRVIRYGMTRDLVLGLEVVLADGTVITALNKMLKNNAGYDLKQLFIGSEGTLGVVTRVVLRLHPLPRSACTALCAVPDYGRVVALLRHAREGLGGTLSAFEMMWPDFYERITRGVPGCAPPLPYGHGAYLLVEALGADQARDQERFEAMLAEAHEAGLVADAVVAHSQADAAALWRIRDGSGEFRRVFWPHVGFDVSIPTGGIGAFIAACTEAARARWPAAETVFFGHVGDANIHIGLRVGDGEQPEHEMEEMVYGLVARWRGSISAEHGIGSLKRPYLGHSRSPEEVALMRALKRALDPGGTLNPGKVI
ncbi:MAG: FAD-binding oxidoreductase, partial [Rhodocyclaceae bacterium]|nr:FAD-binding oxidoreductase [Rhodocyclaceae bacterium]